MRGGSKARLRTKTGCLTCRRRRKKCNEQVPVCSECRDCSRQCHWPVSADLVDRRFASHENSRHHATTEERAKPFSPHYRAHSAISSFEDDDNSAPTELPPPGQALIHMSHLLAESRASHLTVSREMPAVLSRHFVEKCFTLLLLRTCHPGFSQDWLGEIKDLMVSQDCLYYSVLAYAASHVFLMDTSTQIQGLALTYYTKATRAMSCLLESEAHPELHNGLLMSVMLLYLHGCMGIGTYTDIPMHVNAAIRIIKTRLLDRHNTVHRLFDRLAVESVLYQIFLATTGLWTQEAEAEQKFDAVFWSRAEDFLDRSTIFPGQPISLNSPVLGVPISLFRLSFMLRKQYGSGLALDSEMLSRIRDEVAECEALLLCVRIAESSTCEEGSTEDMYYKDASCLFGIIISLLFEQLCRPHIGAGPLLPEPSESWQVDKAMRILRRHEHAEGWSRCFIGNWPVYTLGLFMKSPNDQEVIRNDLQQRWSLTGFSQVCRFQGDLEQIWTLRRSSVNEPSLL